MIFHTNETINTKSNDANRVFFYLFPVELFPVFLLGPCQRAGDGLSFAKIKPKKTLHYVGHFLFPAFRYHGWLRSWNGSFQCNADKFKNNLSVPSWTQHFYASRWQLFNIVFFCLSRSFLRWLGQGDGSCAFCAKNKLRKGLFVLLRIQSPVIEREPTQKSPAL